MPVTRDQAHALATLAQAIRTETSGAGEWDAPGILAQLEALRGMSLAEVMRAVSRLAEDPNVKTPGGLRDMKNPCWRERVIGQTPRNPRPSEACGICGKADSPSHGNDHVWQRNDPRRDCDTSTEVSHLRALIRGGDRDE